MQKESIIDIIATIMGNMNSDYSSRQNHKKAITYLKSSHYCFRCEKMLMYLIIICSVAFCFLGLFFSILPRLSGRMEDAEFLAFCETAVRGVGFASGMFLVVKMLVKSITTRLHIEAVNSIERFDNYVYNLPPNRMILRHITEAQFDNNARKIKQGDEAYRNAYFKDGSNGDKVAVYNNQRDFFLNEYNLMLYVKSKFFNWLWLGFILMVFLLAVAANDAFFNTLLNIFFPSISAISLIVESMLTYNQTIRFLQNTLTQFESAEKDPAVSKSSEFVLRLNQDSIFQYRMNSFNIPLFLVNFYEKSMVKKLNSSFLNDESEASETKHIATRQSEIKPKRNKSTRGEKVGQADTDNTDKEIKSPKNMADKEKASESTAEKAIVAEVSQKKVDKQPVSVAPQKKVDAKSVAVPQKKEAAAGVSEIPKTKTQKKASATPPLAEPGAAAKKAAPAVSKSKPSTSKTPDK